ncbi:hypothetical protein TNCV_4102761 [Trichonephila clavipes]|nr:hypothetical protein TNCV_4102761 [Trichonephila clavipes]
MSSFLVLSDGDTRNRWRDGQVCPDVGQGTMAPWARRLGREGKERKGRRGREKERRNKGRKRRETEREGKETEREGRGDGKGRRRERTKKETEKERKRSRRERERSPPYMEKRAESGDWSEKTMNVGGVENRID